MTGWYLVRRIKDRTRKRMEQDGGWNKIEYGIKMEKDKIEHDQDGVWNKLEDRNK